MYKFYLAFAVSLIFVGCASNTKVAVSSCSQGRTPLDGTCIREDVVDFVSCIRAKGAELDSGHRKIMSVDVGYLGLSVGGVSEASETLERKYFASDKEMMAILEQCRIMTDATPSKKPILADIPKKDTISKSLEIHPPANTKTIKNSGIEFELLNCEKVSRDVHCNFYLMADGRDTVMQIDGKSAIYDNASIQYTANLSRIANKEKKIRPSRAHRTRILANLKTESVLVFPNISTKATKIRKFEITFRVIKPVKIKNKTVVFNDIPFIEKPAKIKPVTLEKIRNTQFEITKSHGVMFEFSGCKKISQDLHCSFFLTADGRDVLMQIDGSSIIFDDEGNQYTAQLSRIANSEKKVRPGRANRTQILADLKTESVLVFQNVATNATTIRRFEIVFRTLKPEKSKNQIVSYSNISFK